jgi:tetratricopeptide (TPR) repeat protein
VITRKTLSCVILLSLLGGCAAPQATDQEQAERRWRSARAAVKLQMAQEQFDAGLVDEAEACLREAAGLNSEMEGVPTLSAKLALARGDWVHAERMLTTECERKAAPAEAFYLLGTVHQKNRHWSAADACYRRAAEAQPENLDYALAVAENLLVLDRPDEAMAWLEERRPSFGDQPPYCLLMAQCHELSDEYAAAADCYAKVLGQLDDCAWLREALGYAYYWSGQFAAAAENFDKAVTLSQEEGQQPSTEIQIAWADCLLATNRPQQALQRLGVLVRERPGQARLWMFLAVGWEACGDSERALKCAQQACVLEPENVEAQLLQAVLADRAGRPDLAKELLDDSRTLAPEDLLRKEVQSRLGLPTPETAVASDDWVGPPYVASQTEPQSFAP